jgi:hypothetical protein
MLIDGDECGVWLSSSNRTFGHSLAGIPAQRTGEPRRSGVKRTVIVFVDVNVGVLAKGVFRSPGTTNDIFLVFVATYVLPAIKLLYGLCSVFVMWDNLSSHLRAEVIGVLENDPDTNIRVINRPTDSCDFAYSEFTFKHLKEGLAHYHDVVTHDNLDECIHEILDSYTPDHVKAAAATCHYPVDGYTYQPYGCEPGVLPSS